MLVASSRSSSRRVLRLCELPRDVPPHVSKTRRRACCALLLSVVVVRKTVVVRTQRRRRRVVVVLVGGGVLTTVAISVAVAVAFGFAPTAAALRVASSNRAQRRRHISHNQRGYRDSYLKRHHRIIIISRIQKGEIIITLLYNNWSRCCFAKARSSFLSKKKFRVGKSSLSIYSVYIYRERVKAFWMTMIYIITSQHKEKGRKHHMKFRVLFFV